ncbi:MAG: 23S rRNA (adenine(2503)-C(2))-methyltransferase RlmN [Patescibacteria group bacterium]
MDQNKLEKILKGEPGFRLKQIKKAVFRELIENWDEISTLPKDLRERLSKECLISELEEEKVLISKDKQTIKALFKLKDGWKIESVLMHHIGERITVCVSSQVGCAMNCQFCATGQQGFKRNLSSGEMVDQVLFFANARITNVVFMGMGEPFLNYDNVLEAIRILNDKDGFNLGARHISVSTAGIIEGIKKFSDEKIQVNLAISLHAPNNKLRTKLMPINKIYPIEKILAAVDNYIAKTNRKVMFEYLMIDGVNDSEAQAEELSNIMKKPLYLVNLISFNPVSHSTFKPSSDLSIKKFREILEKNKVAFTQRHRFGQEIQAACGQLAS